MRRLYHIWLLFVILAAGKLEGTGDSNLVNISQIYDRFMTGQNTARIV